MYLMVVLTILIGIYTVVGRIKSVRTGEVKIKTYRHMDYETMPEKLVVAGRSFNNQFEVPTLFYIVAILCMMMNLVNPATTGLAWAFVASRYLHAFIHLTYNNVLHRMLSYILGVLVVFALWTCLLFSI